ncbi:HAD family hydrolase [Pedobacter panaciterrae]|uniref:HAD family hydrolase n=1 Tax=Pedobacter panaciterrae TaxID=363849 RepID=UPI00155DD290|nr:HAD hydrolase-like protein [Pedobacter panaciterrae]NQX56678.1 HAD family hydrolase [Pedobacter panaciterrae]
MQNVNFIITDLDDTLWDWLEMWYNSFEPYFTRIRTECNLDERQLTEAFKNLHQTYGTTEMSFAFQEMPIIEPAVYHLFQEATNERKSILHEYYSNKKNNLKLYDGVLETLKIMKNKGVKIVAFTESYVFFTKYRIKHLELDGLIDCIYSPMGSDAPLSVYRHYEKDFWDPQLTTIRPLSNDIRKPNPKILNQIIDDFDADKKKTIYIGDKLDRDVYMAQQAEVTSVHAAYGHRSATAQYDLLVKVTHWTDEDVLRERSFRDKSFDIEEPDYIINKFSDLLNIFNYVKF